MMVEIAVLEAKKMLRKTPALRHIAFCYNPHLVWAKAYFFVNRLLTKKCSIPRET
jgi:hypothetical protein